MKKFILSFFKNVKSFNNLLLNLTIKSSVVTSLINILLGICTLVIFTDFKYDDYKNFRNNFKIYLKIIFNYINNLFL
jgi:hypothetical protein